jgi:4-amino-4-deoxy-L-arabinose transferase-like glycosyltransferase
MKVTSKFKIPKSPIRFFFSREQYVDIAVLLAVSTAFLSLSLYQIELPGLYGDEVDKLVPTVNLLTGQPVSGVGWYITIFGFRILVSFTDRIGPVLSYLPMPFILLFGYTPFALRFSSIICGWLTLIFAFLGAKIWFGPKVARYGIAITAVSPVFVFLQRMGYYNYGPVTLFTSLTFFFLARYISKRNSYDLWAGAVFAGIAINTALQAIYVLIPMVLIGVLFWDTIRPRLRELLVALIIFLIVGSPIIAMTLKSGAAFERIGWSGGNSGNPTLFGFVDTLSEEIHHFKGMLGGLDGVQVPSIGKDLRNPLMNYAFGLSILILIIFFFLARDRKEFIKRDAAPLVITLFGLLFTGFIIKGRATYQLIVLWPFAVLVVGAGLAQIPQRIRLISIGIACALVILQAKATVEAHQMLSQTGGRIVTSSQIYPLADYFKERAELRPIAMEWGLFNQIYFLTGGKVWSESIHGWWPKDGIPPDEFRTAVLNRLEEENNVFIFFGPGDGFDRYFHFLQLAKASNKNVYPEKIFYENDGSIAYRLYRVSKSDKAISPGDECFESVPSGRWKGEYFRNKTLNGPPVRVRDDGDGFINFNWGGGGPDPACGAGSDNFSVRWTRTMHFESGTYRFAVTSDDGSRLFVDDQLKLDKWFDQPPTTYTIDVPLSAGNHTVKMEYYQAGGQAVASLFSERK